MVAGHGFAVQPLVTMVCALAALLYLLGWRAARRAGAPPPMRRVVLFLSGLLLLVLTASSPLVGAQRTLFWPLAVTDVLLATVLPLPFVLARPGPLWRALMPGRAAERRPRTVHPLLGSLVSVVLLAGLDGSPLLLARLRHPALLLGSQALLLLSGCAFFSALLEADGRSRTSYPARTLVAFLDGLLDALPGLVVLSSGLGPGYAFYRHVGGLHPLSAGTDVRIAGTAMVALSELVGLPSLLVLLVLWARDDQRQADVIDAQLDLPPGDRPRWDETASDRPWWEADPGPLKGRQGFQR